MNWQKIKDFLLENKKYVLIAGVAIIAFFLYLHQSQGEQESANNIVKSEPKVVNSTSSVKQDLDDKKQKESTSVNQKTSEVTCDIGGAVKNEGVYTLKNGARLNELIMAAGGLSRNAQLKNVNRALILKDQDKIHIPYRGEKVRGNQIVLSVNESSNSSANNASSEETPDAKEQEKSSKVNINTANAQELQKLNGIGEKKAELIVAYRQKNGQFASIEDIKQISGIGDKTFAALKDQLEV
ncbi:MAG: helix-hairpin-helix domain-containing protein [Lactobacillus panisapium]|nr:helix-hairpin-helix domain-containing protein [Lactobacillus panisapium]MCT6853367.1 helix-hairpin-helix domain-containing protein [Lactobacillus panisapium]MCT6865671.1 helix-hairpin-helix domain-containing protein [Lactobacillus panisapium]